MTLTDPLAPAARALFLTRAAMVVERGVQALWLPACFVLLLISAWAFNLHSLLPGDLLLWALVAYGAIIALTAGAGLWRFRWPSRAEAGSRLDRTLPPVWWRCCLRCRASKRVWAACRARPVRRSARPGKGGSCRRPIPASRGSI